jgi:hypothetical protein
MKNVTLAIDDSLLERARKLAAERGTSVNKMVREFLARETGTETEKQRKAREALVELAKSSTYGMSGPWNREEIYAERLSRYERSDLRGNRAKHRSGEMEEGD